MFLRVHALNGASDQPRKLILSALWIAKVGSVDSEGLEASVYLGLRWPHVSVVTFYFQGLGQF